MNNKTQPSISRTVWCDSALNLSATSNLPYFWLLGHRECLPALVNDEVLTVGATRTWQPTKSLLKNRGEDCMSTFSSKNSDHLLFTARKSFISKWLIWDTETLASTLDQTKVMRHKRIFFQKEALSQDASKMLVYKSLPS